MKQSSFIRRETLFLILVIGAVGSGVVLGIWLNPSFHGYALQAHPDTMFYVQLPGLLFIRMMKLLVVPLAMCANIDSFSSLKLAQSGRIGTTTLAIFFTSALIAAGIGASIAVMFKNAYNKDQLQLYVQEWANATNISFTKSDDLHVTMVGMAMNLIPESIFEASFRKAKVVRDEGTDRMIVENSDSSGANLIGILIFSIIFGVIIGSLRPTTDVVADFFHGCRIAFTEICSAFIWTFPLGVLSMVAHHVANTGDLLHVVATLSVFTFVVFCAFAVCIVLQLTAFTLITRRWPTVLLRDMFPSLVCATATASSAATMPLTLKCMAKKDYANSTAVRFVLPLGCTLNMNGTCMFQTIAALFLLQCSGIGVELYHVIISVFCSIIASTITGALPSGSLMSILLVLDALKVPIELVELLLPIDWLLDRLRTPTNVLGNSLTVVIVTKLLNKKSVGNDDASESTIHSVEETIKSQFVLRKKDIPTTVSDYY